MVNMDCKVVNSTSSKQACRKEPPPSSVTDGTSKQEEFQEYEGELESFKLRNELEQANARAAQAELRLRWMSHGIRVICNQMKEADFIMAALSLRKQKQASFSDEGLPDEEDATTISTSDSQTVASSSSDDFSITRGGECVPLPRSRTLSETALQQSAGAGPRARTYSGTSCRTIGGPFCGTVNASEIMSCPLTELPVHQLTTYDTSDLLALQNAAHMLQEHTKLASMEAAVAVKDTVRAQSATREWRARALEAEKALLRMHQENKDLKNSNEKLSTERRILVKEIRKMRKQIAMDSNHLESYVVNALTFHEQQLKMSKNKGKEQYDDDGELVGSSYSETSTVADMDRDGSAPVAGEAKNILKQPDKMPPSPSQPLELKIFELNYRAPTVVSSAAVNCNTAPSTITTPVANNVRITSSFVGGGLSLGFGSSFRSKHAFCGKMQ